FSGSVSLTERSGTLANTAWIPAGAFHTPRSASVRAKTPATAPDGTNAAVWLFISGSGCTRRGKKIAEFALRVPTTSGVPRNWLFAVVLSTQAGGGSTSRKARRVSESAPAADTRAGSTSPLAV